MSEIERRSFAVDALRIERRADQTGAEVPSIVGHAAVFNAMSEDLGGFREMILPGTFTRAVAEDDVRALFNHDPSMVLGRNRAGTLTLAEDDTGLAIEIFPPETQMARDLMTSIERRDVDQMSFGFMVRPGGSTWEDTDEGVVRTLSNVSLFDVSPVTYPAYPQTDVAVRELRSYRDEHPAYRTVPMAVNMARLRIAEIS